MATWHNKLYATDIDAEARPVVGNNEVRGNVREGRKERGRLRPMGHVGQIRKTIPVCSAWEMGRQADAWRERRNGRIVIDHAARREETRIYQELNGPAVSGWTVGAQEADRD